MQINEFSNYLFDFFYYILFFYFRILNTNVMINDFLIRSSLSYVSIIKKKKLKKKNDRVICFLFYFKFLFKLVFLSCCYYSMVILVPSINSYKKESEKFPQHCYFIFLFYLVAYFPWFRLT